MQRQRLLPSPPQLRRRALTDQVLLHSCDHLLLTQTLVVAKGFPGRPPWPANTRVSPVMPCDVLDLVLQEISTGMLGTLCSNLFGNMLPQHFLRRTLKEKMLKHSKSYGKPRYSNIVSALTSLVPDLLTLLYPPLGNLWPTEEICVWISLARSEYLP